MRTLLTPLLAASLLVAGCGGQEDETAQPRPTTSSPSPSSPSPSASPTRGAAVVAVLADGRVVVLDAETGSVQRVLLEGVRVDDPASNAIATSPDGGTVYVVRPATSDTDSEIVRVSSSGGAAEAVTTGNSPAVSPDGGTLAYVRVLEQEPAGFTPTLRLRDLQTGSERELRGGRFYAIHDLTWTTDGSALAFTAGEIETGVHLLQRDAQSLGEARRLGPEEDEASWSDVTALDERRVAVVERCCRIPDPNPQRWRVVAVSTQDGSVGDVLVDRRATLVDGQADGAALLVLESGGPGGGTLLRWDGSGVPRAVAEDVIVAAW